MKALQGTWNVTSLEVDGASMPDAMSAASQIILKKDTFKTVSMGASYGGTFTVDATSTPHTIDITFNDGPHAGEQSLGIFTLDDDTWTLCLGMAGMARPKKFVTTPGSGHALQTLTRSTSKTRGAAPTPSHGQAPQVGATPVPVGTAANASQSKRASSAAVVGPAMEAHGGDWLMTQLDQSGAPMFAVEYLRFGRREVRGNAMKVKMNGMVMLDVTFSLDEAVRPKAIDYAIVTGANKGKTQLGIYELKGDIARYCMAEPGKDRPADFKTTPGDGRTLSAWKKSPST